MCVNRDDRVPRSYLPQSKDGIIALASQQACSEAVRRAQIAHGPLGLRCAQPLCNSEKTGLPPRGLTHS